MQKERSRLSRDILLMSINLMQTQDFNLKSKESVVKLGKEYFGEQFIVAETLDENIKEICVLLLKDLEDNPTNYTCSGVYELTFDTILDVIYRTSKTKPLPKDLIDRIQALKGIDENAKDNSCQE